MAPEQQQDDPAASDSSSLEEADEPVVENRRNAWSQKLIAFFKQHRTKTALALVSLLVLIAYHHKRKKRKDNNKKQTLYQSASVVPLSLLLYSMEHNTLKKVLLGTSRIFFQTHDGPTTKWARVNLPSNYPLLQKEIFGKLTKTKNNIPHVSTLRGEVDSSQIFTGLVAALPFVYLALVYKMIMKDPLGGTNKHQRSVTTSQNNTVTFDDIAGLDEVVLEVGEVVDYLQHPQRYRQVGAHPPRGILLHGPPGSGKTLLARAVAGQANTNCFVAVSASDFCELYVGRGAARVRHLFGDVRAQALQHYFQTHHGTVGAMMHWIRRALGRSMSNNRILPEQPCSAILFIDELDALAKTRSSFGSNDEREQTLNQLLIELEGFHHCDQDEVTLIVIAATNRVDVLDAAILRRFDRQIHVDYPDERGRAAILQIHARRIQTNSDDEIDWDYLASDSLTGGMSGADLRNLINDAALLAVREGSNQLVSQRHLELAALRLRNSSRGSIIVR